MLSSLRGAIYSKVGMIVTFGVLIVIALAFAAGDVTGLSSAGGILGHPLASVDGEKVAADDIRRRAQDELRAARQQQPDIDMAAFVQQGGVESLVTRALTGLALQTFGQEQGMRVSRALIGSELKAIPAFAGATGQFDQQAYLRLIAQRGMTDAQVQREIARETMAQFLLVPTVGATQVPQQLALQYASLLLEKRSGQATLIPLQAGGPAPSDADIQQWYKRNIARYTTPERRVIRYAIVGPQQVAAQSVPTDAEVAQAYAADKAKYAAKQVRDVTLVTVLDQKAAQALADKVKGGTAITTAARAAGLEARAVTGVERATLATQTAPAVADALFAAPQGNVVGPLRGAIGFVVARVDKVTQDPGKTLAQARGDIVAALTKQKTADAIGKARDAIEDALADNASINEVAKDQKLTVQATPAVVSSGADPDQPLMQPDAALAPVIAAGFAAEDGDTPTTVPLGQDGGFAVAALDRIVPATPIPLAQARAQVVGDLTADRARRAAEKAANAIVAKVNAGTPLAAAIAQVGVKAPPVETVSATRAQITANQGQVNPVLAMMFGMKQGTARAIQAPDGRGWLVLRVETVVPGDASKLPGVIQATRVDLGRAIGNEYAQQFANAVAAAQGAKRYPDAIAQLKKDLLGGDNGQ
ncbi:peptidylprolyl isomerase [Sphingomonas endophytica]|uniref:Peptidylprolyl isomerase n=1 Tax=Sphingomonas endophytica TaxID=869719 RepID=A0A147I9R9_9SPHN|nr:peptidylprolyl isomerase [Sphingomonas endophytica]KTT76260.1 peptidylprolyl isomerase [Sphingomonas endophytica]